MTGLVDMTDGFADELVSIRRDIHANPEIGFQEKRTAALVAAKLASWGIDVHRGIGRTGVVGVIRGAGPGACIGLRADMDALPMEERTGKDYRSRVPGVFHGCGHDGHTAMLLGAARYLATTRSFAGTVIVIFQPAEEGLGGARAMIADGLFDRFKCDEIYGLHNLPGAPAGSVSAARNIAMAASDNFDILISGRGSHGAQPHQSVDPTMVAVALAQALQTIVSRNVDPLRAAVLSVTQIEAGTAYNIVPETARLAGTIRTFDDDVRKLIARRMLELTEGIAAGFGAIATVSVSDCFRVLVNSPLHAEAAIDIARGVAREVSFREDPMTGSEDFADMLAIIPGAYLFLGQGDGPMLHNPAYDFNDGILPVGVSLLVRLAEGRARVLSEN